MGINKKKKKIIFSSFRKQNLPETNANMKKKGQFGSYYKK